MARGEPTKGLQVIAHRGASSDCPENTLASTQRAIEVGAHIIEVDVRTARTGELVLSHDAKVDRTTNGKGNVNDLTLAELKSLDAGSWYDPRFRGEKIPTLAEVLTMCKGKARVLLDLKETGVVYQERVRVDVEKHGESDRLVIGVRSVEQARAFRKWFPRAQQIGLIPKPADIESFREAGVESIRLWPAWVKADATLVARVAKTGAHLHLNGTLGTKAEVAELLKHRPHSLSSDNPAELIKSLAELRTQH
jgi:glycerophosphoryl diester phosphodiesterase